jgi:antitoxin MazE
MQVAIRTSGNASEVLIPKCIREQATLQGAADVQVVGDAIETRPLKRSPREGWAADSARLAHQKGDALAWPEFANENDAALQ